MKDIKTPCSITPESHSTRMHNVNLDELKQAKEKNEALLIKSDRDTLDNRSELNEINARLLEIQLQNVANIPEAEREKAFRLMDTLSEKRDDKVSEVDSMESEDLSKEVKKSSLEFSITSTNTEMTKGVDAIISPILGDLGGEYTRLKEERDRVQLEGESILADHTHYVNKELELSEQIRNYTQNSGNNSQATVDNNETPNNSESKLTPSDFIDSLPREYNPFDDLGED